VKLLRSLTFRLALYYAGLFTLSVLLLGTLYYALAIRVPLEQVERGVAREAGQFASLHTREGTTGLAEALERRAAQPSARLAYHVLLDRTGGAITANLPSWPHARTEKWIRIEADIPSEGDEDEHEALVNDQVLADGSRLMIGRDIDDLDEVQETITATLVWLLPAMVLLSLGGGALISRAIGRRIEKLDSAARGVIAGDLSERVRLHGSGDDIDRLGETLNVMLDRIEQGMEAVRRVSDSVAHELRTPLTRLRASLAELDRTSDGGAIEEAIEEAERLETIFNAVLRIGRIEAARQNGARTRIDLAAIVSDAVDLYHPETEARGQRLDIDIQPDLWVEGDRDLLFQAVTNLLDNAVKFAPEGGQIIVQGDVHEGRCRLAVEDDGPGVAPELRARITERFYRAPNTSGVQGAGLGLALVSAVAAVHEAPIQFKQGRRGLRVEWEFPRVRNQPRGDYGGFPALAQARVGLPRGDP
jgi:signal transduction histidine kinase